MSTQVLTINKKDLEIKKWNNIKVLTFDDVDRLHDRIRGTAGRNFRTNKKHFILNEDYYQIEGKELQQLKQTTNFVGSNTKALILLTQTGYLMVVKSFTDDLSWKVQRMLVNNYFNSKQQQSILPQELEKAISKILNSHTNDIIELKDSYKSLESKLHELSSNLSTNTIKQLPNNQVIDVKTDDSDIFSRIDNAKRWVNKQCFIRMQ